MNKPVVVLAPHWRQMSELFSASREAELRRICEVVWGRDEPIPEPVLEAAVPTATVLIASIPVVSAASLAKMPRLKAVIEVSGSFPNTIDYPACARKGIEVLSCAPGFRSSVAEMGLAMALAAARGLVTEHEAFRKGSEGWQKDNPETDFSLYGAKVGFVGFGQIARELSRLLAPFRPRIRVFDPWLPAGVAEWHGAGTCGLEELASWARCLFVTAVPTTENRGMVSAEILRRMSDHAVVVLLSRAHVVDFDALMSEAGAGRLRVAADVFPAEPLSVESPLRKIGNVILSPHRAAAVAGGRHLIGDMIVDDLRALLSGETTRRLTRVNARTIGKLVKASGASQVAEMATRRNTN